MTYGGSGLQAVVEISAHLPPNFNAYLWLIGEL